MEYAFEFEHADAEAALTYPRQAGDIKKGDYAMLMGEPCKIMEVFISKTGKHGRAKAAFIGIQIFTAKKYEFACASHMNLEVPVVQRTEYTLSMLEESSGVVSVITGT